MSNERLCNSDDKILAKSKTLSLELEKFSFSGSIFASSGYGVHSMIAKYFSMLNKIECVDLCSKYVDVVVKIFENENEKIGFLYSDKHQGYEQMNKLFLILFSLFNFNKVLGICYNLFFFFVVGELEIPSNLFHLSFGH